MCEFPLSSRIWAPETLRWLFFFFFCNILPDKFNQSQRTANITLAPARVAWNNSALHLRCYHSSAGNSTLQRKLSRLTITPAPRNEASAHLCEKKMFIKKSETSFKADISSEPAWEGCLALVVPMSTVSTLFWARCEQTQLPLYFLRGSSSKWGEENALTDIFWHVSYLFWDTCDCASLHIKKFYRET